MASVTAKPGPGTPCRVSTSRMTARIEDHAASRRPVASSCEGGRPTQAVEPFDDGDAGHRTAAGDRRPDVYRHRGIDGGLGEARPAVWRGAGDPRPADARGAGTPRRI